MEKYNAADLDQLVLKCREVRSAILLNAEGAELEAKRLILISELTEKIVVFRELVIQGKYGVGPRLSEFLKTKTYAGLKESLDQLRELAENGGSQSRKLDVRISLVGYLEDLLLSI